MLLDYSMTKGAQVAMVRVLSNQLLSKGIRVNAVCPGRKLHDSFASGYQLTGQPSGPLSSPPPWTPAR